MVTGGRDDVQAAYLMYTSASQYKHVVASCEGDVEVQTDKRNVHVRVKLATNNTGLRSSVTIERWLGST